MSKVFETNIDLEDDDERDGTKNELEEYLISHNSEKNNNSLTSFFSKVSTNVSKFVPKQMGGTGNIQDDIDIRFNIFSSSSNSNTTPNNSLCNRLTSCYTLSRKERIIGFFILLGMGLTFFTLSTFYIPLLLLKARKFSILFTFGSIFTFASLSVLWGFGSFMSHLFSRDRLIFTTLYFSSLFVTLFASLSLQSTLLTIIGLSFQLISLLSFVISYLPGGVSGLNYLSKLIYSSISRTIPI